jgi:hypothetical protein
MLSALTSVSRETNGSSRAAVAIERSRTEQETRAEQSRLFGLFERDLLTD